jgi:hypothetical protein
MSLTIKEARETAERWALPAGLSLVGAVSWLLRQGLKVDALRTLWDWINQPAAPPVQAVLHWFLVIVPWPVYLVLTVIAMVLIYCRPRPKTQPTSVVELSAAATQESRKPRAAFRDITIENGNGEFIVNDGGEIGSVTVERSKIDATGFARNYPGGTIGEIKVNDTELILGSPDSTRLRPNLLPRIERVTINPDGFGSSIMLAFVSVSNDGEPTIVRNWSVTLNSSGNVLTGKRITLEGDWVREHTAEPNRPYRKHHVTSEISNVTRKPVGPGSVAEGFLLVEFRRVLITSEILQTLQLSCEDYRRVRTNVGWQGSAILNTDYTAKIELMGIE